MFTSKRCFLLILTLLISLSTSEDDNNAGNNNEEELSRVPLPGMVKKDVPSKYIKEDSIRALFCNSCGILAHRVNASISDGTQEFESLVGFRLNSHGKKIRKQSNWLQIFLSLSDVCDDWINKFRTAKRKDGSLYLISKKSMAYYEEKEEKLHEQIEEEQKKKYSEIWAEEDKMNELLDEFQAEKNLTDEERDQIRDMLDVNITKKAKNGTKIKDKKYYFVERPKYLKKKSKTNKLSVDICYWIAEDMDEWLHEQQKVIGKQMKEGDKISKFLYPLDYCLNNDICDKNLLSRKVSLFSKKKKKKIPNRPPKKQKPLIEDNEEFNENIEEDDEGMTVESNMENLIPNHENDDDNDNNDNTDNDDNDNEDKKEI